MRVHSLAVETALDDLSEAVTAMWNADLINDSRASQVRENIRTARRENESKQRTA